jgi:membrane protein required for colicin V production
MALEGYDLVMLGILAAAAVLGYFKGMVWQVAWIAGIAASSFVALRFGAEVAPYVGQPPPWNRLIAMLALYVATSLVVWLLFRVVSGAINAVHLSAFDRQLGLLLGLAKGVLLCIVITFFSVTLAPAYRHQIVGSRSGRLVAEVIVRADELLPREIGEAIDPFVRQFEEQFRDGPVPVSATAADPAAPGAVWSVVTSAAAWIGPGAGGQGAGGQGGEPAGGQVIGQAGGQGPVTAGGRPSPWGAPAFAAPPAAPSAPTFPTPAAAFAAPPVPGMPQPPAFGQPGGPAPYQPQAQAYQPQAQAYPIGAQTRLPAR